MSLSIKVEGVSKIYRLGEIGTGTISKDIQRWLTTKILGKEDPYLKIGQTNIRTQKADSDIVYSLKDINFAIEQGDAVGIIGRNGAGKSTLLKILSRVTAPTTGKIQIKGRVASLLEVGTGFHPELTGRENIYLNGAILGMRKKEITRKLDEIIDFSGVERYIDTPVKRYSSGMYVRLAFAVAAHLESEILIVDEVLAVGDAEFQRKCLGKMGDISKGDGRTVLFVSHNMEAIISLCSKSILLNNGSIGHIGETHKVIDKYLINRDHQEGIIDLEHIKRTATINGNARYKSIILKKNTNWKIRYKEPLVFTLEFEVSRTIESIEIGIAISTYNGFEIISSLSSDFETIKSPTIGIHFIDYSFEELNLLPGIYKIGLGLRSERGFEDYIQEVGTFEITINEVSATDKSNTRKGILVPRIKIQTQ